MSFTQASGRYELVDGTPIASSWADLTDELPEGRALLDPCQQKPWDFRDLYFLQPAPQPNFTGNVAWRATVETSHLPADFMETVVSNFVGPRKHVVVYYLRRGELVNLVGVVENHTWREESWTVKAPWQELKADYAGWAPTVQILIDAVDKDECYR